MLRFTARRCCEVPKNKPLSPHQVLGVTPQTSFDDIRHRFHILTQQYHPDMPNGDPVKFREINAAYRLLRAQYRSGHDGDGQRRASSAGGSGSSSSSDNSRKFWEERNEQVRRENTRKEQERRDREAKDRKGGPDRRSLFRQALYYLNGYEIAISLASVVLVLLCSVERYFTVHRMLEEKRQRIKRMDEGLPPSLPMEVDAEMAKKYSEYPEKAETQRDSLRILEESSYRRATQRRFDDFREFMFVYDPDGIAARKVSTLRFSYQYMKEEEIPKRCPIIREYNSDQKGYGYSNIQKELESTLASTPWESPDAGYAGALVAKGLGCIAANAPKTTKWTFIEYTDLSKGSGKTNPTCLAAIRNLRFDQTGMCQRVTVTGRPELQPSLAEKRKEDLVSGGLRKRDLVTGGTLPVMDLSIPLASLKL